MRGEGRGGGGVLEEGAEEVDVEEVVEHAVSALVICSLYEQWE